MKTKAYKIEQKIVKNKNKNLTHSFPLNIHLATLAQISEEQASRLIGSMNGMVKDPYWTTFLDRLPCRTLDVEFDYPLDKVFLFKIKMGKMATLGELAYKIANIYISEIYQHEDSMNKFGVWGHSFEDLFLERINIYNNGAVKLHIGS